MLAIIPRKQLKEAGFRDVVMLQLLSLVPIADFVMLERRKHASKSEQDLMACGGFRVAHQDA